MQSLWTNQKGGMSPKNDRLGTNRLRIKQLQSLTQRNYLIISHLHGMKLECFETLNHRVVTCEGLFFDILTNRIEKPTLPIGWNRLGRYTNTNV